MPKGFTASSLNSNLVSVYQGGIFLIIPQYFIEETFPSLGGSGEEFIKAKIKKNPYVNGQA